MALLQISEPDASPAPHQRRLAVGIDLGTTHSLVAAVRSGASEVLRDEEGRALLPSAVRYLADGGVVVGTEALAAQSSDPLNTLVSVKRLMGRSHRDVAGEPTGYQLAAAAQADGHGSRAETAAGGMVRIHTVQGDISPVAASAQILRVLRERAEAALGDQLVGAVVTVPAYFDDAQRQATRDAARLAGLNVLRLLNEPTAAALAYGLEKQGLAQQGLEKRNAQAHNADASEVYAVYDLGGGTFDVSILRRTRGVFEVVATAGDTHLGGDDFDAALADYVLQKYLTQKYLTQKHFTQVSGPPAALTAGQHRALLVSARRAREALSDADTATLAVPELALSVPVTRAELAMLAQPLVARTLACVRRTLRDARLAVSDIAAVVLVGGATRMPVVRDAVAAYFGHPPLTHLDPDQVVALGAALQADLLAGNRTQTRSDQADDDSDGDNADWTLLDVLPLSLGLETMGGLVERIIARNSTIPVARAQEFTTFKDGQTALSLHVVQGERELVADCRSLARFELHGIPPMTAGAARIRVTFQVDADGLLTVTAREQTQGVEAQISVQPAYGLSEDEMARMLAESVAQAHGDARARALREQQVDAARLAESVHAALAADADLLTTAERSRIDAALAELEALLAVHSSAANQANPANSADSQSEPLRAAVQRLSDATETFAARRMDRSIRVALAGRRVADL